MKSVSMLRATALSAAALLLGTVSGSMGLLRARVEAVLPVVRR
jgi:hypothetical protein